MNADVRAARTLRRTIWGSAAFALLGACYLAALTADHLRLLSLPQMLQPYCGARSCDYGESAEILLFIITIGAAIHVFGRLVRRWFSPS